MYWLIGLSCGFRVWRLYLTNGVGIDGHGLVYWLGRLTEFITKAADYLKSDINSIYFYQGFLFQIHSFINFGIRFEKYSDVAYFGALCL